MKKILKQLLFTTPLVVTPLLAASCGHNQSCHDNFYLKYFNSSFKIELNTKLKPLVIKVANSHVKSNHQLNITNNINNAIKNAQTAAKKAADKPINYNATFFDDIKITVANSPNFKLIKNNHLYTLIAFPVSLFACSLTLTLQFNLSLNNYYNSANLPLKMPDFGYQFNNDLFKGEQDYSSVSTNKDASIIAVASVGSESSDSVFTSSRANDNGSLKVGIFSPKDYQYTYSNYQITNAFTSIFDQNTLYVGSENGLYKGINKNNKYTFTEILKGIEVNEICFINNKNDLLLATQEDVYLVSNINSNKISSRILFKSKDTDGFSSVTTDGTNIYACTRTNIYVAQEKKEASLHVFNYPQFGNISQIKYHDGFIYMATDNGFVKGTYNGKTGTFNVVLFNKGLSTVQKQFESLVISNDGNTIYFGALEQLVIAKKDGKGYDFTPTTSFFEYGYGFLISSVVLSADNNAVFLTCEPDNSRGKPGCLAYAKKNWFI